MNSETKHRGKTYHESGFSLMEVLIVVAIIGVLIAIASPVFAEQLENSRVSQDEAAARAAVAAASSEYRASFKSEDFAYVYDGTKAIPASSASGVIGYGQSSKEANYKVGNIDVEGIPCEDGSPNYVTVVMSSDGPSRVKWGALGFNLYSKLKNMKIEDNKWYQHSQQRQDSFEALQENENAARKAADIEILEMLANHFDGMDADEAKRILGDLRFGNAQGSGSMLFEYGQDGGGSIRFSNMDTDYQPYLKDLGYDPRIYTTANGSNHVVDHYIAHAYNYVDTYLFSSEEMLGSFYKTQTFHQIRIKFSIEDGKVANTRIWIDALDAQGFNSDKR